MKTTTEVINKELISHLLMLESEQQESVLDYIKSLLSKDTDQVDPVVQSKLMARAKASNEAIKAGRTKSIDQVRKEVKNW